VKAREVALPWRVRRVPSAPLRQTKFALRIAQPRTSCSPPSCPQRVPAKASQRVSVCTGTAERSVSGTRKSRYVIGSLSSPALHKCIIVRTSEVRLQPRIRTRVKIAPVRLLEPCDLMHASTLCSIPREQPPKHVLEISCLNFIKC
jgi:hypothetical protein